MEDDEILGPSALLAQGPVSMQAVGQPNLSSSLLGALDSPRIPDEAILGLMQQGPSFGQRMGQALAGGVAAMRGQPNPVNAILNAQQQERTDLATMMFRMNQQKQQEDQQLFTRLFQAEQLKDQKLRHAKSDMDKITERLIQSGDPAARLVGWNNVAQDAQKLGRPIDPALLQSLSRGDLDQKTLEHASNLALTDMTDAEIVDLYKGKGLQLKHMPFVRQMTENDDLRQKMGLTRNEDLQMKRDEMGLKKITAQLAEMRETRMAEQAAATQKRQDALLEQGERRLTIAEQNADLATRRFEETSRHNRVAEGQAAGRLDLMRERLEKSIGTKDAKREATLAALESGLDDMDWRAKNLDTKGFLPRGSTGVLGGLVSGEPSAAKAKLNQQLNFNDSDWRNWEQLNSLVTGLDRVVLQEIGPRAKQFFDKQMEMFSNPPSLSAINEFTNQYRKFLRDAKEGKLSPTETVTIKTAEGGFKKMTWRRGTPLPEIPQGAIIVSVE